MKSERLSRRHLLYGVAISSAALVVACSGSAKSVASPVPKPTSNPTAAPKTNASPTGEQTTVSFELWDNNHFDVELNMVKDFQKAFPQIKVDIQHTVAQYLTKLLTQLAGNAAPDVFWLSTSWFPRLAMKDVLIDQSPMIARDKVSFKDYGDLYVRFFNYKGKQLGFPKDWDTAAVIYNKDLFDKAGIPVPDGKWTWNPDSGGDLIEIAEKLTIGSGPNRQYGFVGQVSGGQTFWWNFVWMNGGDILDKPWGKKLVLDSPEAVAAIQFCADLTFKYKVSPAIADLATESGDRIFWSGRAAMIPQGDWVLHNYQKNIGQRFNWGIAPFPKGPKGRISETNSLAYGIWTGSKHQDAAWTYVKWLGKAGEIELAKGGAVFPAYLPAVNDFVQAMKPLDITSFADARDNAHPVPESPFTSQLGDEITKELTDVWQGKQTAKQAADKIVQTMTPVLATGPDV